MIYCTISKIVGYLHQNYVECDMINLSIKVLPAMSNMVACCFNT